MRILALDVGEVYIGVAVSDPLGITAKALPTIKRSDLFQDLKKICDLASSLKAEEVVIGLPKTLKGTSSVQTEKVKEFARALGENCPIKITLFDERLTTKIALQKLRSGKEQPSRKKGLADRVSAVIILQDYLNYLSLRSRDV
ncbi:MAG: Holliday junction resolvase RuvX [Caldiserica bacterium]|jgi:putative Holliday junction resolvase|nr:Holliday junction resolvase RuvX [Caldisericota bacterium]MDH7561947.1 Holliday junction resolvase RuvX [Caldisericota bacterium]